MNTKNGDAVRRELIAMRIETKLSAALFHLHLKLVFDAVFVFDIIESGKKQERQKV